MNAHAHENQFSVIDATVERLGGASFIRDQIRGYQQRVRLMADLYPTLLEQYPDQWVGLADAETMVVAESPEDVASKLDALGVEKGISVIKFMATEPHQMIL